MDTRTFQIFFLFLLAFTSVGLTQHRHPEHLAKMVEPEENFLNPSLPNNPVVPESLQSKPFVPLVKMLQQIEHHFGVRFVYDDALVKGKVAPTGLSLRELPELLQQILSANSLTYRKIGSITYVLKPAIIQPINSRSSTSGSIRGILQDVRGEILAGANVTIEGTPYGAFSNNEGVYTITNFPPGYYTITAQYIGYKTARKVVYIPPAGTVTVNFRMTEEVSSMQPVEITAMRPSKYNGLTTMQLTLFEEKDLITFAPNSMADVLRSVPGIHAEGGGGEVAANIFVRGLPAAGHYKYNPLEEDGMPLISTSGITASSPDIFFRYDLNVEQMEFTRGGVATLFGVGSPSGLINYRSKTGGFVPQTSLQLMTGEPGLFRLDYNTNGPLGNRWRYNLGGFFRYDEGPVVTGLPTRGFQIKGNLTRLFSRGFLRLYGKYLADQVQFFLPFPHDSRTGRPAIGDDGREIRTLNSEEATRFRFPTPDGIFESAMENGVFTRGAALMLEFMYQPKDRWQLESRIRLSKMDHEFNIFIPFPAYFRSDEYAHRAKPGPDGIAGTADDLPLFITDSTRQRPLYSFTYHPDEPFTGQHVINQGAWHRKRPFEDAAVDLRNSYSFKTWGAEHQLTLGAFLAHTAVDQFEVYNSLLMEFADRPRVLDLMIQDAGLDGKFATADDDTIPITYNGLTNAVSSLGTVYINNRIMSRKFAVYGGDRIRLKSRLEMEAGFRLEKQQVRLWAEGVQPVTMPGINIPALQGFQWGNDTFYHRGMAFHDLALALRGSYRLTSILSLYGSAIRGYFFPEIQTLTGNLGRDSTGAFTSFRPKNEHFWQLEGGFHYESDDLAFSASLYHNRVFNRLQTDPQQGNDGVVRNTTRMIGETVTWGIELTSNWKFPVVEGLHLQGNLTLQNHHYGNYPILTVGPDGVIGTRDDQMANYRGHQVRRQPKLMFGGILRYRNNRLEFTGGLKYLGTRFADDDNILRLNPFSIITLDLGYRVILWGKQTARVGINVFNALNSHGLTEGDPRLPPGAQPLSRRYFNARPVLPRRIIMKLTLLLK